MRTISAHTRVIRTSSSLLSSIVPTSIPIWHPSQAAVSVRQRRWLSENKQRPPTGVVMLNMGGPSDPKDTHAFLLRLFTDPMIVNFGPVQKWLGPLFARRRAPHVAEQYAEIGGSPIRKWTEAQGAAMVKKLDALSPATAPHKAYVAFRYADPLTEEALQQMKADGVTRAVAFSQYPQWSCTTTGSSLVQLWREVNRLQMDDTIKWSVLDRWPTHPTFIQAVCRRIELGLEKFPVELRDRVTIIFSAHSLPLSVINKGDAYAQEVGATVQAVMERLPLAATSPQNSNTSSSGTAGYRRPYVLAWQSQVGFAKWLGPRTIDIINGLAAQGHDNMLVVPIAFTSDHIETLHEIDVQFAEVAQKAGVKNFHRAPSLNDEPLLTTAQAELVAAHLASGRAAATSQFGINCAGCTNPECRTVTNPIDSGWRSLRQQLLKWRSAAASSAPSS